MITDRSLAPDAGFCLLDYQKISCGSPLIYLFTDFPGAEAFCSDGKALHCPPLCILHRHAHPL